MTVNDYSISLNTLSSGHASTSLRLNGKLEGFFFQSRVSVGFKISIPDKDIVIFESVQIGGSKFIPCRLQPLSEYCEIINYAYDNWCLNDEVLIELFAGKNTDVKIVLRLSEYG